MLIDIKNDKRDAAPDATLVMGITRKDADRIFAYISTEDDPPASCHAARAKIREEVFE